MKENGAKLLFCLSPELLFAVSAPIIHLHQLSSLIVFLSVWDCDTAAQFGKSYKKPAKPGSFVGPNKLSLFA